MKHYIAALLLGAASTVDVQQTVQVDQALMQESEQMKAMCKDMDQFDESSFVELDNESEADADRHSRQNKNTYKKHFGKTKKQIDAQNRHILGT